MADVSAPDFAMRSAKWGFGRLDQLNASGWTGNANAVVNPWAGKWTASADLAATQGEEKARVLRSFLARSKGRVNTFRLYATAGAQNSDTGVTVATDTPAGANTITLSGYSTPLKDGQLFTVSEQLLCCVADQSGGTVTFQPKLREEAASGDTVETSRPYALVCLADSKRGWAVATQRMFGISIDVEEAVLELGSLLREDGGSILREDGGTIRLEQR